MTQLLPVHSSRPGPATPLRWWPVRLLVAGALALSAGPLVAQPTAGRAVSPAGTLQLLDLRSGPTGGAPAAAERQRVLRERLNLTAADDMRLLRAETDELGFTHERYQPYYQGVKVEHASVSLHVRGGKIETLSGDFARPAPGASAQPQLTEATALRRATAAVGARQYMWQLPAEEAALRQQTGNPTATYQPTGELVWVRNFHPTTAAPAMVLAWKFNIYAADPVSRAWIYVDARTGQIVLRDNIIKHVNAPGANFATRYLGARTSITDNTGSGYRLRETATGKGVTTLNLRKSTTFSTAIDFVDNDNNWTAAEFDNANFDNAALDAHLGAQVTQDYWTNVHNRDSYDDKGSVLLSYVHYGNGTDNAYWNGTAMLYGDGSTLFKPLTAIDVCGHEIGHAVCETTAGLVYQNESGAMNEGFSDIWGCCVENHLDPTKQKYLIGEDICKPSFGLALRSMSNPNQFSQPDTYKGTNWATGASDNGGVHTNSGVLNFWFYLLSNGGSGTNDFGTAFNVTGITIAKAEKIAYRTERVYLTSSSDYAACRKASMQAAIDLYGLGSAEVQNTARAWRAVGVGTTTGAAEGAPTITSFSPTSGLAGTVVTITGTNLGATMRVTFNGADATIATLTSGTSLTVTVPPGATTGLISLSTAAGTVTTSALSPANFTITAAGPAPVITSFLPSAGQAQGGSVTISGTDFTGATAVSFNGTAAAFTVVNATTITTTVPAGATTGSLKVTTPNGTATAPTTFKVRPAITSFSPTSGVVGTAVTLTGTSLTGTLAVKFNGVYVSSFTVVNSTTITTTVPNGATTGPIFIHTPNGDTTSVSDFTVTPSLAFTSFSPTSGAVITTVVNIQGRGFTGTSAITFGGVNAPTFTVASNNELFVTVPVGAITGNIVVTTPLGAVTSPSAFTVTAPLVPTITSFTPASGAVGDPVTITGTNFTGATAVTFNGTGASFTVSNSTTIFTTVPAGATTGVIRVTVPGGTATSATNFSVVLPGAPAITSFTPANGNAGTVVTLTGTNFNGTTAVAFNGTAASFTFVSSTSLTATAPAGGTTGQISVTNGFGTGLSSTSFFYPPTNDLCANTGLPVLTCGGSVSGTTVNSTSTGDPMGTCGTSVQSSTAGGVFYRFVGTGASVTMTTCAAGTNYDTKLFVFTGTCGNYTCVTGNDDLGSTCGATGNTTPSTVTFTSVAGTNYFVFVSGFNSNQGNFTLTATCTPVVPTITSFTPTSGPVGTSVGITGTNFTTASGVTFNGTAATAFTVNSATSITATVPAGATTGPIGVTTSSGGSGVSGSNFTVTAASTTTSLTSSVNPSVFGQSITLTATVVAPGSGSPTGTVTFKDGVTTLGTGTLNGSGQATFTTSSLLTGNHALTAVYNGDANFLTSTSGVLTQGVNQAATTTSLTSNLNPSFFGQSVTLTATVAVAAPGAGTITNSVTFKDGATTIGTGLLNGSGQATFTTSSLTPGSYSLTAVYDGDANFLTSTSATLTQVVNQASTATTLTSSLNPSVFGQSVTLTATAMITSAPTGPAAGTVTFKDGVTTLGTTALNVGGQATFTTSTLAVGNHSVTAVYNGNASYSTSTSGVLTQVVDPAPPTNQAPTAIGLSPQSVAENTPGGTAIGNFSTTDPDAGDTFTYSFVGGAGSTDNGAFSISGNQLVITASPDFETKNSYAIRVRSTDQGSLFFEQTFTITVTNQNEAPAISPQTFGVAENAPNGTLVGNVAASDPDAGTSLTYSITGGNTGGAFSFGTGGQLVVTNAAALDFETNPTFALTVQVSDGSLSNSATVTVNLTNQNEAPSISPQTFSIAENSPNGTTVGTVAATDPDAGTLLTYSITGGNTGGAFSFVGNSLRVANVAALDFETTPTFTLTVQVSDGALANAATVTVNLSDVVETAPDLTVSTAQAIPAGTYRNITITATGTGTLGGAVVVEGALVVQNGGTFEDGCQVLTGPGTFTLEAGTTMRICHAQGIAASGTSGAVQVTGARSFSPGASYIYAGTGAQSTGTGLPTTVQNLSIQNGTDVTLTLGTRIRRVLTLASSGNLVLGEAPLTLLSDATGTAMVENAGTGRVVGIATVQRYLTPNGVTGLGYHHLSSPVENTTVADLTVPGTGGFVPVLNTAFNAAANPANVRPYPTVFGFDETRFPTTADFSRGYFSPASLASALVPGRGYSVYMKPLTPDFVGTLNSGTVSVGNLTRTGSFLGNDEKSGWHLLGNPYPSPLDWDLVTVPQGMDASISVFQTKGGNGGIYLTRANGVGTLPDGLVAMGAGFFARVTGAAPVPFAFDNSMRVTSYANPNAFRAAPEARPLLSLTLARPGATDVRDEVTVYFQEGASAGADARFDGFRPGRNQGDYPTLATVVPGENGGEAAVDAQPLEALRTGTQVELLAVVPQAGTWTLTLGQLTNLDATPVVLLDRQAGTRTPLAAGAHYIFTANAGGEVRGRFALAFGAAVEGPTALTMWPNPAHQQVQLAVPAGATQVTVLDATGRVVRQVRVSETGAALNLSLIGLPTGVYVVKAGIATSRLVVE